MPTFQVLSAPGVGSELMLHPPANSDGYLLYWLPAMGTPARSYQALSDALAVHGIGMALHEWRGIGSSTMRAARGQDWGYRQLLCEDIPAGIEHARRACPNARLLIGGHSLGGQLGTLSQCLQPGPIAGLVLVASGAPYWRVFGRRGQWIRLALTIAPLITWMVGYLPGRRLGFAGNEAHSVIKDWARSGREGRYEITAMDMDFERKMASMELPVLGLHMQDDRLCPAASMRYLVDKMPRAPTEMHALSWGDLGVDADHFGWMEAPAPIAERLAQWTQRLA
jgi:predicted alpha/beta hydrolase